MEELRIKSALRYVLRFIPILVIAVALVWFFWLRSSGQANKTNKDSGDH